jgi:hypothetical protein
MPKSNNTYKITLLDLIDKKRFLLSQQPPKKVIDDCGNITTTDADILQSENVDFNTLKTDYVHLKIMLTQDVTDLGLYQNYTYIEKRTPVDENISPLYRRIGVRREKYFDDNVGVKRGITDSKIDNLIGFGGEYKTVKDEQNKTFSGVLHEDNESIEYIQNAFLQVNTYQENTGVKYKTSLDSEETTFEFQSQSFNENNIDLKELVFDEIFLGVHEIDDTTTVLPINRGNFNIFQQHLSLQTVRF